MGKIAFVFPGQGSQYVGMGKDLYEKYDIVKKTFKEASKELNLDMAKLCFESEEIHKTEYTQVALVTMSVAIMRLLEEKGIKADIAAGLSLGEYAALVCSGALEFSTALFVVRKRGLYMQECIPAGEWKMAAVIGLEDSIVENVCENHHGFVRCANYNCPGQIVIAGEKNALEDVCKELIELGARKTIMLNVSGPFHTDKLIEAKEKLEKVLENVKFNKFNIPVIRNIDANIYEEDEDMKTVLSNHIISSVQWSKTIEQMIKEGVNVFIELGPGKTLSGFIKKINKEVKVMNIDNVESFERTLEYFNR